MEEIAEQIAHITSDYHCDVQNDFQMTPEHILEWVNQFEESDREFILSELAHLLSQGIYISREKAITLLEELINKLCKFFKYSSTEHFLNEVSFLNVQPVGKSQSILLGLLDEILVSKYGKTVNTCGSLGIKNYIYLDDLLGTGKTFVNNVLAWIENEGQLENLKSDKVKFLAYFFCIHTWGKNSSLYSLKMKLNEDVFVKSNKFVIGCHYLVENNIKDYNPKLNLIYPQETGDVNLEVYLSSLIDNARSHKHKDKAFRPLSQPSQETFFSSKENRKRLETIFLEKGIEIINRIQDEQKRKNHRPLGKTYPSYQTFGTGTMFFTWSNISNTCPIVLWWNNPAHNWKGLFPLNKRGNN